MAFAAIRFGIPDRPACIPPSPAKLSATLFTPLTGSKRKRSNRFVRRFFAEGGCGLNVTIPHKARALAIADEASGFARRTRAANVLSRRQDKIVAYNTDGGGFIRDLLRHFPDGIGDKRILLMGAGGAARAVACAIADEQPAAFYLSNRTRQKAEALAEMTGATVIPDVATMDRPLDIIVNASAAGHEGKNMPFPPKLPRRTGL